MRKAKYASHPDLWEHGGHLGLRSVICQGNGLIRVSTSLLNLIPHKKNIFLA